MITTSERMRYTPGSNVASGEVVVLGGIIGVAIAAITALTIGILEIWGEKELAATTADAWAAGDRLYWNASTKKLTDTVTTTYAGIASKAKVADETTANVYLNMSPGKDSGSVDLVADPAATAADPAALTAATITDNSGGVAPGNNTIAAVTNIHTLTNSTGGTADQTLEAVGATNSGDVSGAINNNFTEIHTELAAQKTANTALLAAIALLAAKFNLLLADVTSIRTQEVAVIDDVQANNAAIDSLISGQKQLGLMKTS